MFEYMRSTLTFIVLIASTIAESIGVPLPALRPDLGPTKESLPTPAAPIRCLQIARVSFQKSFTRAVITLETVVFKISQSPSISKLFKTFQHAVIMTQMTVS